MKTILRIFLFSYICLLSTYSWSSNIVLRADIGTTADCPSGQFDPAGVCIDTTTCPSGQYDAAGVCLDSTPTPIPCESGLYDAAGVCIDSTPTPTPVSCESGLYDAAGVCIETTPTPTPITCEGGQFDSAGQCIETTPEPSPTVSPEPTPTPSPTQEPTPSPTPSPEPEPTASPIPSATPEPTATPTPIPTNIAALSCIKGEVTSSLGINALSLVYQTLLSSQNIWAEFEFSSQDTAGNIYWKLKNYGTSDCVDNTGTVDNTLNIRFNSLEYQTDLGTQDIWAELEFIGENQQGELIWKLNGYGINE